MHTKSYILCGLVCIAGIFGAFSRWIQNVTAFEQETGLATQGALWSIITAVYLTVVAVVFICVAGNLVIRRGLTTGTEFPDAFAGRALICNIAAIAAFAFMGLGGILMTIDAFGDGGTEFFLLVCGISAFVAAVALAYILRTAAAQRKRRGGAAFIVVVLFLCLRLISEYRASAADPVIWHFGVRILAVSACTLAFYYLAGYCYGNVKPGRTLYFSMMAILLSIVTIADGVSVGYHLITSGLIVAMLALTLLLSGNMIPAPKRCEPGSDETT